MNPQLSTLINTQYKAPSTKTLKLSLDSLGVLKETVATPLGGLRTITASKSFEWLSNDLIITDTLKSIFTPETKEDNATEGRTKKKEIFGLSHGKKFGLILTDLIQNTKTKNIEMDIDEDLKKIESDLLSPFTENNEIKLGQDVYLDVLTKFKKQLDNIKLGINEEISDIQNPQNDNNLYRSPSDEAIEKADNARLKVLSDVFGGKEDKDRKKNYIDDRFDKMPKSMQNLIKAIDLSYIELSSFSGKSKKDYINGWLKTAENLMAEEDYFRAQKIYHSILIVKPGHPLARVGIIHAQLGSGMVRSAVYNLRKLFVDHPELLKIKYKGSVIPTDQRMKEVRVNLEKLVKISRTNDAAIALAYIAFQGNSPKLISYALDIAQTQNPKDTLVFLLRKLWVEGDELKIKSKPKKVIAKPVVLIKEPVRQIAAPKSNPQKIKSKPVKPKSKDVPQKTIASKTTKPIKKKQKSNLEFLGGALDKKNI